MGGIKRHPREDRCASCGCDLPLDSTGGYTCEVFTCSICQSIVCEECSFSPASIFLSGDVSVYLINYLMRNGHDRRNIYSTDNIHHTYCKTCLVKMEEDYINSIPAADLLLHVNEKWVWDEGHQLFSKRLSEGR